MWKGLLVFLRYRQNSGSNISTYIVMKGDRWGWQRWRYPLVFVSTTRNNLLPQCFTLAPISFTILIAVVREQGVLDGLWTKFLQEALVNRMGDSFCWLNYYSWRSISRCQRQVSLGKMHFVAGFLRSGPMDQRVDQVDEHCSDWFRNILTTRHWLNIVLIPLWGLNQCSVCLISIIASELHWSGHRR